MLIGHSRLVVHHKCLSAVHHSLHMMNREVNAQLYMDCCFMYHDFWPRCKEFLCAVWRCHEILAVRCGITGLAFIQESCHNLWRQVFLVHLKVWEFTRHLWGSTMIEIKPIGIQCMKVQSDVHKTERMIETKSAKMQCMTTDKKAILWISTAALLMPKPYSSLVLTPKTQINCRNLEQVFDREHGDHDHSVSCSVDEYSLLDK